MEKFETFSTTADVGIRIEGEGYAGLFGAAVKGLHLLLFDCEPATPGAEEVENYGFEYRGDSPENLLVNLLAEMLFLLQTRGKVTVGVRIGEIDQEYLKADLLLVPSSLPAAMEIKSVTYHNLEIRERDGIMEAEVVFDV